MPNSLTISYNNSTIHTTTSPETLTIDTEGTYCEHDIDVNVDFLDTSDANATADDIVSSKSAYVNGVKIVGTATIPSPSSATPQMDGTGAAGSSTDYARGDHVHPHDSSKQDDLALSVVNGQICVTYTTA